MKNIFLKALCLCFVCFTCACSSDLVDLPEIQVEDQNVKDLVSLQFDKNQLQLSAEDLQDTDYETRYVMLENGDYEISYIWSFQKATIVVHNTEKCWFGNPSEPVLEFSYDDDNTYIVTFQTDLIYVYKGETKTTTLTGKFKAVIND